MMETKKVMKYEENKSEMLSFIAWARSFNVMV